MRLCVDIRTIHTDCTEYCRSIGTPYGASLCHAMPDRPSETKPKRMLNTTVQFKSALAKPEDFRMAYYSIAWHGGPASELTNDKIIKEEKDSSIVACQKMGTATPGQPV